MNNQDGELDQMYRSDSRQGNERLVLETRQTGGDRGTRQAVTRSSTVSRVTYNYRFLRYDYGFRLQTGGGGIGTMSSNGWTFDGQIFARSKRPPHCGRYNAADLQVVVVTHLDHPMKRQSS